MRSAIEAPIALALESIWQSRIEVDPPCDVLLTGLPPRLELTAARINRVERTLKIEITDYAAIHGGPAGYKDSLRHFGRDTARGRLIHAGRPVEALAIARELGRSPGPADVDDRGELAVAIGAILHGGLLLERQWVGQQVSQLEIERTAPVAVGVLGTNKAGEWFWRRVIDKGSPIRKEPTCAGLNTGGPAPARIALAECPHRDYADRLWLIQDDWPAAGLRWHEIIDSAPTDGVPNDWDLLLKMSRINFWNSKAFFYPQWHIRSRAR